MDRFHSIYFIGRKNLLTDECGPRKVSEISWSDSKWEKLDLASDKEVIQLMKATVCGIVWVKTHQYPQSNSEWERQIVVVQKYTAIPRIEWTRW